MNKKGFTLIEIIAVVAILGMLGAIVSISFKNTLEKTEEEECTNFIDEVTSAVCVYASLKTTDEDGNKVPNCKREDAPCQFKLKDLYANTDILEDNKNKCTKASFTNEYVEVNWNNSTGEKICECKGCK